MRCAYQRGRPSWRGEFLLIGVPRETAAGENRVALVPDLVKRLRSAGADVAVEAGAGVSAHFPDALYTAAGARIEVEARALWGSSDAVLKVQPPTAEQVGWMAEGAALIGLLRPATDPQTLSALAARRVTAFALDLMPRISRAQSMDVLSSQSSVAGYSAVIIAAHSISKIFPLMMTAAGTVTPARVLVIGAGVAGLQAIATARRLGALVEAYDIRPAVREEVQSLGAKFLAISLESKDAVGAGGYAKAQSAEFQRKQAELLSTAVAASDVVITTAAVPGKRAPVLVSAEAVSRMRPGSVVIDLAAEEGGNCALTKPGETVVAHGVSIQGPVNIASAMANDASRMYAHNAVSFLLHIIDKGALKLDLLDEITRATLVTRGGAVTYGSAGADGRGTVS